MSDQQDEPKIVVDEDWKARVRAEREAAKQAAKQTTASASEDARPAGETAGGAAADQIPPASFDVLITTFAVPALTAMGKIPDPVQGHPVVRPDLAKHYIDMLSLLEEKTKGNLTKGEAGMLDDVLHQLRMTFVTTRKESEPEPQQKEEAT
jgi:hypothetical protein